MKLLAHIAIRFLVSRLCVRPRFFDYMEDESKIL